MNTEKLTGKVLFGNILKPKSYSAAEGKFVDDPRGGYQLTLVVDKEHKDYKRFLEAVEEEKKEIMAGAKYKKLIEEGKDVTFSLKDKQHTDKSGAPIEGRRQISLKRNAINRNNENVSIEIFDRFNEEYQPEHDVSTGTEVQAAFGIGNTYISKDETWYITFYLFAVMIEKEVASYYGFDVKESKLETGEHTPDTDTAPDNEDEDLPF